MPHVFDALSDLARSIPVGGPLVDGGYRDVADLLPEKTTEY